MILYNDINFQGLSALNMVLEKLPAAPNSNLFEGRVFYNTSTKQVGYYDGTTWRYQFGSVEGTTVDWSNILNRPTTFSPSAHTHTTADIYQLDLLLSQKLTTPSGGTNGKILKIVGGVPTWADETTLTTVDWTSVQNKPTTFTPSIHTHTIADVVDLANQLSGKANTSHIHAIGDVTGLQSALNNKSNVGHGHSTSEITGLDTTLSNKSNVGHTHSMSDIVGLVTALSGKAATTHTHSISDISGLSAALDSKQGSLPAGLNGQVLSLVSGTPTWVDITGGGTGGGTYTFSEGVYQSGSQVHAGGTVTTDMVYTGDQTSSGNPWLSMYNFRGIQLGTNLVVSDLENYYNRYYSAGSDGNQLYSRKASSATTLSESTFTVANNKVSMVTSDMSGTEGAVELKYLGQSGKYMLDLNASPSALGTTGSPVYMRLGNTTNPVSAITFAGMMWYNSGFKGVVGSAIKTFMMTDDTIAWTSVTGKPATFTPSAHTHSISDVTSLQSSLDAKAALSHTHAQSDIVGLSSALAAKLTTPSGGTEGYVLKIVSGVPAWATLTATTVAWADITSKPTTFAPSAHTHTIADVTNLQTTLDGKQAAGSYAASVHTHAQSDITGLATALNAKLTTPGGMVDGLVLKVSGGVPTWGTQPAAWADITSKPSTFAPSAHTHAIADVTSLQTTLDGKAASVHTHAMADITGLSTALAGKQASLPGGTNGQVLTLVSGSPAWTTLAAGTSYTFGNGLTNSSGTVTLGSTNVASNVSFVGNTSTRVDWSTDEFKNILMRVNTGSTLSNLEGAITMGGSSTSSIITLKANVLTSVQSSQIRMGNTDASMFVTGLNSGTDSTMKGGFRIYEVFTDKFAFTLNPTGYQPSILQLGNFNNTTKIPYGQVGGMYYNTADSKFYGTKAVNGAGIAFLLAGDAIPYSVLTGTPTIPTATSQLTNDSSFITKASLSAGTGLSYNSTTGVFSLGSVSTTSVSEGSNLYFTDARVGTAVLSGYTLGGVATAIANTDTLNSALSKLQNQVSGKQATLPAGTNLQYLKGDLTLGTLNTAAVAESTNLYFTSARVLAQALTGLSAGTNAAISATDTILAAFGKVQAQIDGKQAAGSYSLTGHTHAYSSLTGIPSTFAPSAHTHAQSEVTGLTVSLSNKSDVGHAHAWSDITSGKPTTIAGYGITDAFNGAYSSLTGVPTTFAPSAHTHAYSELTGLPTLFTQTDADALYSVLGHTHAYSNLTGLPTLFTQADADALYGTIADLAGKQATLVSGTNIKTINGTSLLGSGDITISGGSGSSAWADITGKPTTIAGYGITDAFSGAYADLTGKPTLFTQTDSDLLYKPISYTPTFNDVLSANPVATIIPYATYYGFVDGRGGGGATTYHNIYGAGAGTVGFWDEVTEKAVLFNFDGVTAERFLTVADADGTIATREWTTAQGYSTFDGAYASLTGAPTLFTSADADLLYRPIGYVPAWSEITSKPTTIAGYGITDAFSGAYADLTGKPTLFSGSYTDLTDKPTLFTQATADGLYSALGHTHTFASLTSKPTTIAGYGITDAFDGAYSSLTGKPTLFTQATADTLYRPIGYIPSWTEITSKPTTFAPSAHTHAQSEVTNLVSDLAGKQATLVSGTNIKTINGSSVLGSGDLTISGSSATEMFDQKTGVYVFEDFIQYPIAPTSGTTYNYGANYELVYSTGGSGTGFSTYTQTDATQFGVLNLTVGTTSGDFCTLHMGSSNIASNGPIYRVGNGEIDVEFLGVKFDAVSGIKCWFGLYNPLNAAPSDGSAGSYIFYHDNGTNLGKVTAKTGAGGSTLYNTSINGTVNKYRININAAGTTVTYYVNDTLVATHTTGISTTTALTVGFKYAQAGSAAVKTAQIDAIKLKYLPTTARW